LIDVDYALKNLGGKEALLLRLVKQFVLSNGNALDTLKAHLQEGDRVSARRVAHSLKGSAATLGMRALRERRKAGSRLDGRRRTGGLVDDLDQRLQEVIATLQPISSQSNHNGRARPPLT
jgi:HPt (histidine-containing phosphotransfer) domain-containing protein